MNKTTILIVEDERLVAENLSGKLANLGYEVAGVVADGEEAVALAGRLRPNLVLMDIWLNGPMDGIEAAEAIRRDHDTPVIYLTAHSDAATLARAKITDPFGYILKPFEERQLATQIELALHKHRADREIRERELRLRLAQEHGHVGVWDWYPATGEAHFCNEMDRIYGLTPGTISTYQEWLGHIHPDDVKRVEAERDAALARHEPFDVEFRILHGSGEVRWICSRGGAQCNAAGRITRVLGINLDITERKRIEEALQSVAKFPNENPYPVIRIDWEGIVVYANRSSAALGDELRCETGRPAPDLFARLAREALADGRAAEAEVETGGRVFLFVFAPISDSGYVNLYGRDVTDRKRAEEALAASEAKFRDLANSIPQLAWIARPDGSTLWFNERWYEYTGTTPEQMEGWGWQSVHDPNELPKVLERWKASIASGQPFDMEFPLRGANGQFRWFLTRVMPFRDSQGRIAFWFGTNTDITERREAAEHLQRAKDAAESASQAKTRFLANISHELRTPMNSILGMVDLALPKQVDRTVAEFLKTAKDSADLLLVLLNDLVDCAKIEFGELHLEAQSFSLRQALDQITRVLAARAAEKGIDFSCSISPEVPDALVGDRVRLQQVLLNLGGNGIKFTERGELAVAVSVESRNAAQVCLGFTVRDTGIGISAAESERLFQPFAQADPSTTRRFGGVGLGLSIASSLVGLMGGRISVESEPQQGSTFRFAIGLPLAKQERPVREAPGTRFSAKSSLRILLVEDNPANQKFATFMLKERGHKIDIAGDGQQGLCMAQENQYDVILMDVQMPVMDGLEATKAIRAWEDGRCRVPIIAVTAHAMKEDRERCVAAGMDGYLSKPIDAEEMFAMLDRVAVGATLVATAPTPEPVTTAAVPIFDPDLALKRCMDSQEMLAEMIQCFYDEFGSLFPQMKTALQAGDFAEVGRLGHRLKGTVVYLGAEPATEAAQRLAHFSQHTGEQAEVEEAVKAIERECEMLKSAIKTGVAGNSSTGPA